MSVATIERPAESAAAAADDLTGPPVAMAVIGSPPRGIRGGVWLYVRAPSGHLLVWPSVCEDTAAAEYSAVDQLQRQGVSGVLLVCDYETGFRSKCFVPRVPPTEPQSEGVCPRATATKTKPARTKAPRSKTGRKLRADAAHRSAAGEVVTIAAATEIHPDTIIVRENQRKSFDPESLKQLEADIRRQGILQPLVVRSIPDDPGRFELIAGERRLRAALMAGLKSVPVIERDCADEGARLMAQFSENDQREDLNPIERAAAIAAIIEANGWKQKDAAAWLGCTPPDVSNQLRLLQLPENPWQQWVAAGKLAPTAVRPLCAWTNRPQVLQWIVDKHATEIDEGGFVLREEILHNAIRHSSRPTRREDLSGTRIEYYAPKATECHFLVNTQDPDDVKALDIQTVDLGCGTEERCWNLEEFEKRNQKPLKTLREKHKAAKEKRVAEWSTPESRKAGDKAKPAEKPIRDVFDFGRALTVQLRSELAGSLKLGADKFGLQKILLYLASQETACDIPAVMEKILSSKSSAPADVLQRILQTPDKDWKEFLYVIVRAVLTGEGQNGAFLSEGLSEPDEVVRLAGAIDVDLLASFQPDRAVLETMSESYLRQIGTQQLGLKREDQPDDLDGVLDWLQVDWPEGWLCPEMKAYFVEGAAV